MNNNQQNHLYFLRHCETENNNQELITGQMDVSAIENEIINLNQVQTSNNLVIFSSTLQRCQETTKILLSNIIASPKIYFYEELKERNMGIFEGMKKRVASAEFSEYFFGEKFIYHMTPPEGESFVQICNRVDWFIENILSNQLMFHDVLICSHNHIMKILYFKMFNISIEENWYTTKFTNGAIYRLI